MNLHSLLGERPGSAPLVNVLETVSKKVDETATVPKPVVTVYRDAVYYSYLSLGISFNFEPSRPLLTGKKAPQPDPNELKLVAIHIYSHPTDNFATFPLPFSITIPSHVNLKPQIVELDMTRRAHEVVSALGEPEKKEGGGRAGNCWIGYQATLGVSFDLRGSNWEDKFMSLGSATLTAREKKVYQ